MKMMKCCLILCVFLPVVIVAQVELSGNGKDRVFRSFEEAAEVNPDSVHVLCLGNHSFATFPEEVFKYKNLYSLSFNDQSIDYYYRYRPGMLTEQEKKIVEEGWKKFGYSNRAENIYPVKNRNSFHEIPKRIAELKSLEVLILNEDALTRRKLRKLKRALSRHCEIMTVEVYPDSLIILQNE